MASFVTMTSTASMGKDDLVKVEKAIHCEAAVDVREIGTFVVAGLSAEDAEFFTNYPEQDRKRTFRKVHLSLVLRL